MVDDLSIKIFNEHFDELKIYEEKYNIIIKGILFNESNEKDKNKLLLYNPDYYLILLNDFINEYKNKESEYLRIWFHEYKQVLKNNLNNYLNNEFYDRHINIIIKIINIKEEINNKIKEKFVDTNYSILEKVRLKKAFELEIKNELYDKTIIYDIPILNSTINIIRLRREEKIKNSPLNRFKLKKKLDIRYG